MPGKPVISPVDYDSLSNTEKQRVMHTVNLIKGKHNGKIKGRGCLDGRKQHKYIAEHEIISSPTASLEGLITTAIINVYKNRKVITSDVSGLFLHPEIHIRDK